MSVLVAMPQWAVPSELWLQRMNQALEPHISAIAAHDPPETYWRGRVPAIKIPQLRRPLWKRIARRIGVPIMDRSDAGALTTAISKPDVTAALVHYLPFALELEDVWQSVSKPVYVHVHGFDVTWDLRYHDNPHRRMFPSSYLPSVRRLCRRVTLIANSHHTAERLAAAGISRERIVVKYLGVPAPPHPPVHSLRTSGVHVLYLGRLVDFKGPDATILAFERACALGLDGRLTLAGDGPLRARCEALRAASPYADRIELLGAVDAAVGERLRADADIFTAHNQVGQLSRQEEAYGVSVVEAMADAIPVVSGRNGGLVETVVHNETGLLFEPGDVEAHASALLLLGQEPALRRQMGEAGWRRARDLFSIEREREQLLTILGLRERVAMAVAAVRDRPIHEVEELSR